jgi:hypothetical protein
MHRGLAGTVVIVVLALAAFLAFAPGGLAAPNNGIYSDFARHGKLEGNYTKAELEAALKSAFLQGYGATGLKPSVQGALERKGVAGHSSRPVPPRAVGTLPFTGLDLGLIAAGGGGLLLLGRGLRHFVRAE